jgi:hypothetical protein
MLITSCWLPSRAGQFRFSHSTRWSPYLLLVEFAYNDNGILPGSEGETDFTISRTSNYERVLRDERVAVTGRGQERVAQGRTTDVARVRDEFDNTTSPAFMSTRESISRSRDTSSRRA